MDDSVSKCIRNGVKAYVVIIAKNEFYIEYVIGDNKPKRLQKRLNNNKEANDALIKTYKFLANKL
jgi:hypothetical protein